MPQSAIIQMKTVSKLESGEKACLLKACFTVSTLFVSFKNPAPLWISLEIQVKRILPY